MGKEAYEITGTVDRALMVDQIRKAARQFAMQYFRRLLHHLRFRYPEGGLGDGNGEVIYLQAVELRD